MNPTAFFKQAQSAYHQAEETCEQVIDHFYSIGGFTIQLRFAGPALVPLIAPALRHLAMFSAAPDLTILLWDSVSTGVLMPPPPWSDEDYVTRGDVRGFEDDRIHTAFHRGSGVLNLLDSKENVAIFWLRDAKQLPYYESGAPLRTILHLWMRDHKRLFTHAAAVGKLEGGVLLAGKGGSGKSTSALSCLDSPLVYVSDDYCLLSITQKPFVYSLYNTAKVEADNLQRLPFLDPLVKNKNQLETEKALIFLHEAMPQKIVPGFPVKAILIPRVTGRPNTTLRPSSAVEGLRALAPSTIFQLSGAGQLEFKTIGQFVRNLPCYFLDVGTDLSQIPATISQLLNGG